MPLHSCPLSAKIPIGQHINTKALETASFLLRLEAEPALTFVPSDTRLPPNKTSMHQANNNGANLPFSWQIPYPSPFIGRQEHQISPQLSNGYAPYNLSNASSSIEWMPQSNPFHSSNNHPELLNDLAWMPQRTSLHSSNNYPEILNDLAWSLEESEVTSPNISCLLCSKESSYIKLTQLLVEEISENDFTYKLGVIHAPSHEYWMRYKTLITTNLMAPLNIYYNLVTAIQEEAHCQYQINASYSFAPLEIVNILSTYLGCTLKDICLPTSKNITTLLSQSSLQYIFKLLLAAKKEKRPLRINDNNLIYQAATYESKIQTQSTLLSLPSQHKKLTPPPAPNALRSNNDAQQASLLNISANSPPPSPQAAITMKWSAYYHSSIHFNTDSQPLPSKSIKLSILRSCPQCETKAIKIPHILESASSFFEHVKILNNHIDACIQESSIEHSYYLEVTYNKVGRIFAVKQQAIEIKVAEVDNTFPTLLKRFTTISNFSYEGAIKALDTLASKTEESKAIKHADYNVLNKYVKNMTLDTAKIIEKRLIIIAGIIYANKLFSHATQKLKTEESTTNKSASNSVQSTQNKKILHDIKMSHIIHGVQLRFLGYLLQIINEKRSATDNTEYNISAYQKLIEIRNTPPEITYRKTATIEEIIKSKSPLETRRYNRTILGETLLTAVINLQKERKWIPQENSCYALCLPFPIIFNLPEKWQIDISSTPLSIVAIDRTLMDDWNVYIQEKCKLSLQEFIPSIIQFLIREKYDALNAHDTQSINTLITNNLETIQKALRQLLGIKFAQHLFRRIMKSNFSPLSSQFFNFAEANLISESLEKNTFDKIIKLNEGASCSQLAQSILYGSRNRLLVFFMQKWQLPTDHEIQALEKIYRSNIRQKKKVTEHNAAADKVDQEGKNTSEHDTIANKVNRKRKRTSNSDTAPNKVARKR